MDENSKSNKIIILILVVVVFALAGLLVYEKLSTNKNNENNNVVDKTSNEENKGTNEEQTNENTSVKYTNSFVKGKYEYFEGSSTKSSEIIELYENGMFSWTSVRDASFGFIGNYYIDENKIIMNKWFEIGNSIDISTYKSEEKSEIIIETNNNDVILKGTNLLGKSVEFQRKSTNNEENIYDLLNKSILVNETYTKEHLR